MSQPLEALAVANKVRMEHARLKRLVAAGDLSVADVLLDHRESVVNMPIGDLLTVQRQWGRTRTGRFMSRVGMDPSKRIGTLTVRQVGVVVDALGQSRLEAA